MLTNIILLIIRSYSLSIDQDTADDLMSSFEESYDNLQYTLNKLSHQPQDNDVLELIFTAINLVKHNARITQIEPLMDFSHAMTEVVDAMLDQRMAATEQICDLLLVGTDRLRELHNVHLMGKPFCDQDEDLITIHFIALSESTSQEEADQEANTLYHLFYPDEQEAELEFDATFTQDSVSQHESYLDGDADTFNDLLLFRSLAIETEAQNNFWQSRNDQLLYLGVRVCRLSQEIHVDATQLVAAIYMHDVGMAFLHHDLVNKQAKLDNDEFYKLKQHVDWSYHLLARMPAWQEAVTMVYQHHEKEDGSGYPNKLSSQLLHEGAKIIAILDAFFAMTNLRSDRSHRRSILRAISEINACSGTQFNPYWVNLFNQVIRDEVKKGIL